MNKKWPMVKLGEVLTPAARGEAVNPTNEYRLLGIRLDGKGPFLRETLMGTQTSASRLFRVEKGDFIYSRLFACRGAFGVINEVLDGCYVSGEFPTFVPLAGKIDVEYLKYWFRLPSVIERVDENCSGSTPMTRNRFKEKFFLELEIPLPPLAEQQRLVKRIEELAEQINEAQNLREEAVKEVEAMLHSVFMRMVNDAGVGKMKDLAPLVRRPVETKTGEVYPELGIRSFGKGTFHKPALDYLEVGTKRLFRIQAGDLLFSNVFAWEGAITIAKEEDDGRFGSHRFITCVPLKGMVTANYLRFYFLTDEGLYKIGQASPGGAGRNRTLGLQKLEEIRVPVPDYKQQIWFDELCEKVQQMFLIQTEAEIQLNAMMPTILDRAFMGEL